MHNSNRVILLVQTVMLFAAIGFLFCKRPSNRANGSNNFNTPACFELYEIKFCGCLLILHMSIKNIYIWNCVILLQDGAFMEDKKERSLCDGKNSWLTIFITRMWGVIFPVFLLEKHHSLSLPFRQSMLLLIFFEPRSGFLFWCKILPDYKNSRQKTISISKFLGMLSFEILLDAKLRSNVVNRWRYSRWIR